MAIPARQRRAVETEQRLLDAARDAFAELGYPATRVADIVARAGTSHGTFYTYFKDKQAILEPLTEAFARELYSTAIAPLSDDPASRTPRSAVRARTRAFFDAYRDNHRFVRAWTQAAAMHPEIDETRRRIQDSLADTLAGILARDQHHGLIRPDTDVELAATALTQMTEHTASRWIDRGRELDDAVADQLTDLWVRALYGDVESPPPG